MKCLVITQPGKIEEMNLSGREPYIVVPVPQPNEFWAFAPEPQTVLSSTMLQALLRRHTIRRGGAPSLRTPEEFVAYWPDSWRDEWALAEFKRWEAAQ